MSTDANLKTNDIVELLDEIGMDFALHTHHPLTHLDLGDASAGEVTARGPVC